MAQANGSEGTDRTHRERGVSAGRQVAGHAVRRAGFWGTVGLPFLAVGILLAQPHGWLPLLVAVFLLNGIAVLAGHCYSREC